MHKTKIYAGAIRQLPKFRQFIYFNGAKNLITLFATLKNKAETFKNLNNF